MGVILARWSGVGGPDGWTCSCVMLGHGASFSRVEVGRDDDGWLRRHSCRVVTAGVMSCCIAAMLDNGLSEMDGDSRMCKSVVGRVDEVDDGYIGCRLDEQRWPMDCWRREEAVSDPVKTRIHLFAIGQKSKERQDIRRGLVGSQ